MLCPFTGKGRVASSLADTPDQSLLVSPLHNVERGTLKDSLTVAGGEVDSAARPTTHSSGDSLTLAILWLRARTPNP